MRKWILTGLAFLLLQSVCFGAITHSIGQRRSFYYEWAVDVETLLGATAGTATANKAVILGATANLDTILFSSGQIKFTPRATPSGTAEGTLYADTDNNLYYHNGTTYVALGSATFEGGNITADVKLNADNIDILSDTTTDHTYSIQGYDVDGAGAYRDVLRWTNGSTVAVVLGASADSLAIASTGLNVTTAGAVTGVTTLASTGAITAGGGLTVSAGNTAIGNDTGTFSLATTGLDISTTGNVSPAGDIIMATGKGIKASMITAETVGVYGYDIDGKAYVPGLLVTSHATTPTTVLGNTSGTTAISSSDWTISTIGAMAGIDAITMDGLLTGSAGATITGAAVSLNASSNYAVNLATGNSTGAVTIGSTTTAQAITIQSGTGDVTVTSTDDVFITAADDLAINGGSNGSILTIGGNAHGNTINIGTDNSAADTITIGSAVDTSVLAGISVTVGSTGTTSALVLQSGTGDVTITSTDDFIWTATDDITINGGSTDSIINIGTNTHGNAINIGTNNSTADTITIGSALDTCALAGIAVTVGSTGTSSALTLQSGTGNVTVTSTDDISITATDDLTLNGGSLASVINIGTNNHGNVINIATNDTAADTITIGSAQDGTTIKGGVLITALNYAADGEASDAYVITLAPAATAYSAGMMIIFKANTANTGACTVNVNGLGAKALKSLNDNDPPDSYIEANSIVVAVYDGTNFQMVQPDANP